MIFKPQNKLINNAIYQTIYQILSTITPLITSPYISRELGAKNLGIFSYSNSIVTYFVLFAMLGVVNYGARTIAQCDRKREILSKCFWSIYSMQIITALLSLFSYVIYIIFASEELQLVALMQLMLIIGSLMDVNWFFFGMEDFKLTVTRNIIIKTLTVASILIFVKKDCSPLLTYAAIMAGGTLMANLSVVPFLNRYIDFYLPSWSEVRVHIRANIKLFIPLLASSVFHVMDKTMLGKLAVYEESGYYYNADKLINIPISILIGLGTVFLPRVTILFKKSAEEGKIFLRNSLKLNMIVSFLLAFGIAGCASDFVPFFFGAGFEPCIQLVMVFTPVLIIKSISMFHQMQFLVPTGKERVYIIATFFGALCNGIANGILIPQYGAMGAVIGTMIAETSVMIIQIYCTIREIPSIKWLIECIPYGLFGVVIMFVMRFVSQIEASIMVRLAIEIASGGLCYFVLCFVYWLLFESKKVHSKKAKNNL